LLSGWQQAFFEVLMCNWEILPPLFEEKLDASGKPSSNRVSEHCAPTKASQTEEFDRNHLPDGRYDRTCQGVTAGPRDVSSSDGPDAI